MTCTARRAALAVALASAAMIHAGTAAAESCGPLAPVFAYPAAPEAYFPEDDGVVRFDDVPANAVFRVHYDDDCSGMDESGTSLTVTRLSDDVAVDVVATPDDRGPGWVTIDYAIGDLEPGVAYQACARYDYYDVCIDFDVADDASTSAPPSAPSLEIARVDEGEEDSDGYVGLLVSAKASWEAFDGVVWVELRDGGSSPKVLGRDTLRTTEASELDVSMSARPGEACAVAVARNAQGETAESDARCFEVGGGCSVAPGGRGGLDALAGLVALSLITAVRRARQNVRGRSRT